MTFVFGFRLYVHAPTSRAFFPAFPVESHIHMAFQQEFSSVGCDFAVSSAFFFLSIEASPMKRTTIPLPGRQSFEAPRRAAL